MVVDINPTAARLLSLAPGSALGQPIGKIMPNWANLPQLQALLSTVDLGPPQSVELMLLDNQTRYVDLAITNLFDRNNRASGRLITLHDVTRRKLVEQALAHERNTLTRRVEERTSDLSEANAQLARAARLKDEFLASMSHELRTPLNTILGLSEALQEQVYGPLSEKQLRALHSIEESGRHLLALINDILDVSKIEAGQLSSSP
jgi:signal transduction histidine kinase